MLEQNNSHKMSQLQLPTFLLETFEFVLEKLAKKPVDIILMDYSTQRSTLDVQWLTNFRRGLEDSQIVF